MAEALYPGGSPVRPDLAEILPVAVVEALVARSEGELRTMWLELQEIVGSAESAERRLKANRVAAVYDDAFESDVLAYVRRVVEPEAADRLSLTTPDSPVIPSAWANGHSSGVEGALPPPPVVPSAPVASPPPPPPPPPGPPGGLPSGGASTGQVQATPRSSPKPRTTVVDRGHRPAEPTHATPSAPPPPPPVVAEFGNPLPAWAVPSALGNAQSDSSGSIAIPAHEHGWTSRIPARLLMQVGLVMVVAALLLLKLG
jgi:hypothetical protein